MHLYSVYDLCIASDFPLAGLPEGGGAPDVTISSQPLSPVDLADVRTSGSARIAGLLDDAMPVLIEGGHSVVFNPPADMQADEVAGFVTGALMAAVLRQRGLCVLHASAVARDGVAVAFLGHSGWGKSTLAEAFLQSGYDVLTDDILALDFAEGEVRVRRGPPYIRLRPGAGKALMPDTYDRLPPVAKRGNQRLRMLPGRNSFPIRLRGLFVLDPDDAPASIALPLTGQEAILPLLAHSWGKRMFIDPASMATHLQQCGELARRVPIFHLRRVRSLEALPEHISLVEESTGLAGVRC